MTARESEQEQDSQPLKRRPDYRNVACHSQSAGGLAQVRAVAVRGLVQAEVIPSSPSVNFEIFSFDYENLHLLREDVCALHPQWAVRWEHPK